MKAQELINVLDSLGYTIKSQMGSHMILKHPKYESIVTIPMKGGDLPKFIISSVKKNVVEKGVTSESNFLKAINKNHVHHVL